MIQTWAYLLFIPYPFCSKTPSSTQKDIKKKKEEKIEGKREIKREEEKKKEGEKEKEGREKKRIHATTGENQVSTVIISVYRSFL